MFINLLFPSLSYLFVIHHHQSEYDIHPTDTDIYSNGLINLMSRSAIFSAISWLPDVLREESQYSYNKMIDETPSGVWVLVHESTSVGLGLWLEISDLYHWATYALLIIFKHVPVAFIYGNSKPVIIMDGLKSTSYWITSASYLNNVF